MLHQDQQDTLMLHPALIDSIVLCIPCFPQFRHVTLEKLYLGKFEASFRLVGRATSLLG